MSYADIVRGAFGGDRFTIISNLAARDRRLHYKARGLLTAIGSHREGWGITAERLAAEAPDGIASVRSGLKELEQCGYLRRYRLRDEDGKLRGARWVITDDPDSLEARIAELATQVGEEGLDLFQRQNTRSEPKCDFPTLDNPPVDNRMTKKTSNKNTSTTEDREGEEDARAREIDPPTTGNTTNDDADEWGIAPTQRPAAEQGTLLARTVITQIAEETGLGLEPWQHKRLALEHIPSALAAVKALGDDRVSGTEFLEWLRADHDTTMSLYAVLSRRCAPDYLAQALPVWVARTRTPGGLPAPSKPTQPRPRTGGPDAAPDPFSAAGAPPTCTVHPGIALTADATGQRTRCHQCEAPLEPAPVEDTPAPTSQDLVDVIGQALPDTEPDMPDHCGNRTCHEHRRHIIRFNPITEAFEDLGPCPQCNPNHAQESAA